MEIEPSGDWDRRQCEFVPKPPALAWSIDRALEVLLGDILTEEEQWWFDRRKYAKSAAEKFIREFIEACDCQPKTREM